VTAAVPDFSFGWSALALAAAPLSQSATSGEATELRKEAWEAAEKSIELDSLNPEGYMAMAGLLPLNKFAEREELLKKAIGVRPTECGCERQFYGDFLTSVGRMEEAVEQYERARSMIPLAPFSNVRLAQALHVVGRHDEADRIITEMIEVWPDAATLRLLKVKSAYWTGRYAEAIPLLDAPDLHLTSEQRQLLAATFQALASNDPARKAAVVNQLQSMARNPRRNDRMIVAALAALDADAAALDASRRLIHDRGHALAAVLFEPNLSDAWSSPQYEQLVTRVGLTDYWKSTNNVPDICREEQKPGFCVLA
jgi:tetratricopeptide (TPR) repeat protein